MHYPIRYTDEKAAMAIRRIVLLLTLACAFFAAVDGNFTMHTPLKDDEIQCLDQCHFFADNQTIAIINATDPKITVSGVAYYTTPIRMKDPATKTVASFNTTFTFREEPKNYNNSPYVTLEQMQQWAWGDGFTFMMSSSNKWIGNSGGRLGIFSSTPLVDTKVVAVEFDSFANSDVDKQNYGGFGAKPKDDEHMGLDIGSAISNCTANLSYQTTNLSFWQRHVLHAWIEYDGNTKILELRVANTSFRPSAPILTCPYDLYDVVDEKMWIGFSGAIGNEWTIYYMYNWTFTSFGISSDFPSTSNVKVGLIAGICGGIFLALLAITIGACAYRRRKRAQQESWDKEGLMDMSGMPEFISYKHLSAATKQFSEQSKLGQGGFGSVYEGVLPKTGAHVAVKKVSNDSRQGEREFMAEVQIISQLRHRNVVELTGFCRDRGKFLLVYELLPNGSLDQALFKPKSPEDVLSWGQRWKIVSGTAAALHYLHEGWRQQVIHRDVKSSNIMLDDEYNAKLGDFGLARLVDHSKNAATTMVAGTYGYIAPEAAGGRFTDKTDVFAFGVVALEVACGRRAHDGSVKSEDDLILVDMVWRRWKDGTLLSVADHMLQGHFDEDEMCTVLKLGLLCSHPEAASRPSMRQVVQVLAGEADVPEVPEVSLAADMPHISINDLLNPSHSGSQSNSNSGRGKRPANDSLTSNPSSSSLGTSNSVNSFNVQMRPR